MRLVGIERPPCDVKLVCPLVVEVAVARLPVPGPFGDVHQQLGGQLLLRQPFVTQLPPQPDQALVRDIDESIRRDRSRQWPEERGVAASIVVDHGSHFRLAFRISGGRRS